VKPAIAVCGLSHAAYLSLLARLADGGRYRLLLLEGGLAEAAAREGLDVEVVEGAVPLDGDARIMTAALRSAELLRRPDLDATFADVFRLPPRPSAWPALRARFAAFLATAVTRGVQGAESARALLAAHDVRLVVCGFDVLPFQRAFLGTFHTAGVPSLHVPHGVFGPTGGLVVPGSCSEIFATRVAAPGDYSRRVYAENGQPPERVVVTGVPRWDPLPTLGARSPGMVRLAMGLDPNRPLVVFATSWVEWATADATNVVASLAPIFAGFLRGVRRTGGPPPQVVVKFHPSETADNAWPPLADGYRSLCEAEGVGDVLFRIGDAAPWLAAADVVVSINSSLALETLLARRVPINVPVHPTAVHAVYGADTAVLGAATPDDLAALVEPALRDPAVRATVLERRAATVADYVFADDGRASERVAAVAHAMLAPERARSLPSVPPLVSVVVAGGDVEACRASLAAEAPGVVHEVLAVEGEALAADVERAVARARGRFVVLLDARAAHGPGWLTGLVAEAQGAVGTMGFGGRAGAGAGWAVVRRSEWTPYAVTLAPGGGFVAAGAAPAATRAARREAPGCRA